MQVPEVQQISANYLWREDRLLLRAWLPDQCEAQLLLTQRIAKGLIEGIDKMADRMVSGNVPATAQEQAVAEFARETAVEQGNFSQALAAGKVHPMMKAGPRLVTSLAVVPVKGNRIAMTFGLEKGDKVEIRIPVDGLWSLAHIIDQQMRRAEWDQGFTRAGKRLPVSSKIN